MSTIAHWSDTKNRFVIYHGSMKDTIADYQYGEGPLDSADVVIVFPGVDEQRLLQLAEWASQAIEEDVVATTDPTGLDNYVEGEAGVQREFLEDRE